MTAIAENTAIAILNNILLDSLTRSSPPTNTHRIEMSSGVSVNPACLTAFQELKLRKKSKFIIFKLSDDKTEIIKEKESSSSNYDDFLAELPETQCRWAVYDLEFQNEEGNLRKKIIFLQWSPENAKIKDKMVTASSREPLRRSFDGVSTEIQGTDYSEVAYDTVLEKAKRLA